MKGSCHINFEKNKKKERHGKPVCRKMVDTDCASNFRGKKETKRVANKSQSTPRPPGSSTRKELLSAPPADALPPLRRGLLPSQLLGRAPAPCLGEWSNLHVREVERSTRPGANLELTQFMLKPGASDICSVLIPSGSMLPSTLRCTAAQPASTTSSAARSC